MSEDDQPLLVFYCRACDAAGLTKQEADRWCHGEEQCKVLQGWACYACGTEYLERQQAVECCP